jgi:hypothetical protein
MKIYLLCVSAVLLGTAPAFADVINQSQGATLKDVGNSFAVPVESNPFDPALGALTQVTLSLEASFSGTVGIENESGSPDVASGVIGGSVTVSTLGDLLSVEVFPDAVGPTHDFAPFDGALDYAGASGATDSVSGADVSASAAAPPPASALSLFIGSQPIFLTLTATSLPLAEGQEMESVTETANALTLVSLTYDYRPASSVPEHVTLALGTIGFSCMLGLGRWRASRTPLFTRA